MRNIACYMILFLSKLEKQMEQNRKPLIRVKLNYDSFNFRVSIHQFLFIPHNTFVNAKQIASISIEMTTCCSDCRKKHFHAVIIQHTAFVLTVGVLYVNAASMYWSAMQIATCTMHRKCALVTCNPITFAR